MLEKIQVKREYLLIAASIILLFISYEFAFKKTIEAWQLHTHLQKQIAQSVDVGFQPGYVERKSKNLDEVIDLYKADTTNFRSNIISKISSIAEKQNVKLSEVPIQDPLYHTSHFLIQKLEFEGDFFSLIKVLKELQSTKEIGMIRMAYFKKLVVLASSQRKENLELEIYLEMVNA